MRLLISAVCLLTFSASVAAQWHGYPTPGVPRLPDGKPNLDAQAPRMADGKPELDQAGYPASDALRITERLRRRDFGHIDMEMIIDDSKMYTRPWSIFSEFTLQVDTELLEFICEENEKDADQLVGN